jgi:hypothetical protein
MADWGRAQQIAAGLEVRRLHRRLAELAQRFCPIHREFGVAYHWSVDQCEYATDVVFRRQADLAADLWQPNSEGDSYRQTRQRSRHSP